MNRILAALSALLLPAFALAVPQYDYVRLPASMVDARFVQETGFIRDHSQSEQFAFGYLEKSQAARLRSSEVTVLDAWEWASNEHDPNTLELIPAAESIADVFEAFHTYDTLTAEVNELAKKYPNLVKLESVGKTVQGRDMWLLRVTSNKLADPNKPKLLYASSMHGDEVTGKEMLIYLVREMLSQYGTDARLTALMDNAEIFLIPSVNPDGTEKRQRWNANGVDLNRDFPEMGEDAFSMNGRAIETRNMMELYRNHRFPLSMNFHGGSLCVNLPWDHKPNTGSGKFADDEVVMHLAKEYARANKPMWAINSGSFVNGVTYGYEWYQVLGGMQDWSIWFRDTIHTTLEISGTKWPSPSSLPRFWDENRESLIKYLEGGLTGVHLQVTDAEGKALSDVTVETNTSPRPLKYDGFVHRVTVPTEQVVTVKAAGFDTKTLTLPAEAFRGEYRQVSLQRSAVVSERARLTRKKGS